MNDMIRWAFRGFEQTVSSDPASFPKFLETVLCKDGIYRKLQSAREFFLLGPSGRRMRYMISDGEVQKAPVILPLTAERQAVLDSENWLDAEYEAEDYDWRKLGFSDPNNWLIALKQAAREAKPTKLQWDYPEV